MAAILLVGAVIAMNHEQIAAHAINTTESIREALNGG